jgi:hypothetical protein
MIRNERASMNKFLIRSLKKIPLYVLLFPALSVLILAVNNLGQLQIGVIIRPLLFSMLAFFGILLISWLVLHDLPKAGLFTFSLSVFLLTYGHLFSLMEGRMIGDWVIGAHTCLLILWGMLFLISGYLLTFRIKDPANITLLLNVVLIIMTLFQVTQILTYEVRAQIVQHNTRTEISPTLLQPEDPDQMPDVYFIILDKYARSDALRESFYEYDNSEFIHSLEDLGFWVADCSRSNYAFTVMSLSSQLNMAYVEDLTDEPSLKTTRALIENNRVHEAFEEIGYTTIAFEMGFSWGNMKHFDYYFDEIPDNIDTWSLDPFEILYLRSTVGILIFDGQTDLGAQVTLSEVERMANRTKLILDVLPEIPKLPGPKFIHAHIVTPHPPFIFKADGTLNENPDEVEPVEGYRQQLAYIEPRILSVLSKVIETSEQPPVIILEGDHGFGKKYVTSNLLALYLPEHGAEGLSEHMTLINVFPHIFNTYFGTDLETLPDLSFTHTDDWYQSVPLEEWNPDCKLP